MDKLKVLFVNGNLNVGGVEMALVNLLNSLDFDRYSVDLLLLQSGDDYIDEIPESVNVIKMDLDSAQGSLFGAIIKSVKMRNWFGVSYRLLNICAKYTTVKAFRYLKLGHHLKKRYDVAVSFRPGFCADLVNNAIYASKKICWWHHGSMDVNIGLPVLRRQLLQFDKVVAVSNGVREMLGDYFPQLKSRICVIPNIVDESRIRQKAKEFLPYPDEDLSRENRIVTVSRLSSEKNVIAVAEVAKILKAEGLKFKWYVIGDGACRSTIETKILEYGLDSEVILAGQQSNPYPWIKGADFLVHVSPVESFGLVIIEAMVLKTMTIAVESIGAKELINQNNGILVKNDAVAIANTVVNVINRKYETTDLINKAYSDIQKYSFKKISNIFNDLCDANAYY